MRKKTSLISYAFGKLAAVIILAGFAAVSSLAQGVATDSSAHPDSVAGPAVVMRTPSAIFAFSGDSRLVGELSNRQASYSQIPQNYATWEFNPVLSVYDVPFTMNLLLSTQQDIYRQKINSVRFGLDYQKLESNLLQRAYDKLDQLHDLDAVSKVEGAAHLKDSLTGLGEEGIRDYERVKDLTDLDKVKEKAFSESMSRFEQLGLVSEAEKFFSNFPSLEVGVTYPEYTAFTMSGVPVTGANVEWNPGKLYLAFSGGKSQRAAIINPVYISAVPLPPAILDTVAPPMYSRTIYSGRLGYGKKDGDHFFVTGLYGRDDETVSPVDSVIGEQLQSSFTAKANYVFGLDTRFSLFDDHFALEGEIDGSMLTSDVKSAQYQNNDIPSFVSNLLNPTISSFVDYGYSVKPIISIPETDTKITGLVRMVGPGYVSLGAPTLRSDLLRFDVKAEQKFIGRQVTVTAGIRQEHDNLINWKSATTTVSNYTLGLGLNFHQLPWLRMSYTPYTQKNDAQGEFRVNNNTSVFSATAGYGYRIGTVGNSTSLSYSTQQSTTLVAATDYGVNTLNISHSTYFDFPLSLTAGLGLSSLTSGSDTTRNVTTLDLAGGYSPFPVWQNSVGFNLSKESGYDSRIGFFVSSTVNLWNYADFELRAEKNVYTNTIYGPSNYDEFILRSTLSAHW